MDGPWDLRNLLPAVRAHAIHLILDTAGVACRWAAGILQFLFHTGDRHGRHFARLVAHTPPHTYTAFALAGRRPLGCVLNLADSQTIHAPGSLRLCSLFRRLVSRKAMAILFSQRMTLPYALANTTTLSRHLAAPSHRVPHPHIYPTPTPLPHPRTPPALLGSTVPVDIKAFVTGGTCYVILRRAASTLFTPRNTRQTHYLAHYTFAGACAGRSLPLLPGPHSYRTVNNGVLFLPAATLNDAVLFSLPNSTYLPRWLVGHATRRCDRIAVVLPGWFGLPATHLLRRCILQRLFERGGIGVSDTSERDDAWQKKSPGRSAPDAPDTENHLA